MTGRAGARVVVVDAAVAVAPQAWLWAPLLTISDTVFLMNETALLTLT